MDRWRPPWTRKKRDARSADPPKPRRDNGTGASLPPSIPTLPHRAKPEASSVTHTVSSQTHDPAIFTSLDNASPTPAQASTSYNNRYAKRQERPLTVDGNVAKKEYWQLAIQQVQQEDPTTIEQIAALQHAAAPTGQTDLAKQLLHATE